MESWYWLLGCGIATLGGTELVMGRYAESTLTMPKRLWSTLLLAWVLVSHAAWHECVQERCVPRPDMPSFIPRTLSSYATANRCELYRAAIERDWARLEAKENQEEGIPSPQKSNIRLITWFACES